MSDDIKKKMKEYGITSVPTTIIDGNIKVVGIPDFPWICGRAKKCDKELHDERIMLYM